MQEWLLNTRENQAVIDRLVGAAYQTAMDHGFWSGLTDPANPLVIPTKLMLIVSETAEALKADRDFHDDFQRNHDLTEELADVVIRAFDLAGHITRGTDSFGRVLLTKMETNMTRPKLHGKRY